KDINRSDQTLLDSLSAVLPPAEQPIARGQYKDPLQDLRELNRLHVGADLTAFLSLAEELPEQVVIAQGFLAQRTNRSTENSGAARNQPVEFAISGPPSNPRAHNAANPIRHAAIVPFQLFA